MVVGLGASGAPNGVSLVGSGNGCAMDPRFETLLGTLDMKCRDLLAMPPVTIVTVPRDTPLGGVYLFSDRGEHLYVGRTKRRIRERLRGHVGSVTEATFALRLAREATKQGRASYRPEGSRRALLNDPRFVAAYEQARVLIRAMQVRYVEEADPIRQALLEIYVAVVTGAKHNDFDTH